MLMTLSAEAQRRIDSKEPVTLRPESQDSIRVLIDALMIQTRSPARSLIELVHFDFK